MAKDVANDGRRCTLLLHYVRELFEINSALERETEENTFIQLKAMLSDYFAPVLSSIPVSIINFVDVYAK